MEDRKDRFSYSDGSQVVKPNEEILCKSCIYRLKDYSDGYKRAICIKYSGKNGSSFKPKSILFENGKCQFFKKE